MNFIIERPSGRFNINVKKCDFTWSGDSISMWKIGFNERDPQEYVLEWIPSYVLKALDDPKRRGAAIRAISDYIAGWYNINDS